MRAFGCDRSQQRAQTFVEFALVAPIFFAVVIGIFSVCTYVLEVQVANDSAQAAARWGVLAANFAGTPLVPQCPDSTPPAGMVKAAQGGAGPFAGNLTVLDSAATPPPNSAAGTYGCEAQVTIPYISFGRYFGLGPRQITATAMDFVE